jgi:hypothetical protein
VGAKEMKKHLVLTIAVGDTYKQIAHFTHPTLRAYAERIGADFMAIDESNSSSPHWEKFQIYDLLNQYERIIYLDTDVLVRDDCPDLFDVVPASHLGVFNEAPFTEARATSLFEVCKEYDVKLPDWDGKYFNTGVMVISRVHKYLFKKPDKEAFSFYEQGYLNMKIAQDKIWTQELRYQYNRMSCMDAITGEERHASYIMHYAGFPDLLQVLSAIQRDVKKWEMDSPDYDYRRHLYVDVQGGFGDQAGAEPSIRFMRKNVYPDADIKAGTHFPRLFKHLPVEVGRHGEVQGEPGVPYRQMVSLPGPETFMWSVVSNLMCHTVDFVSMALLKRTLPLKDRQVKLLVEEEDLENLRVVLGVEDLANMVAVHPGRHWENKTFPADWWQAVIDGIHEEGVPVCLIGREDDDRGTVDVQLREGMLDSRNLLDVGSFIALLSQAKVLVSNDSAPVHVAGAFDNHIVLIPTCKHPDHVLPYRRGSVRYKAIALYKKLVLDDMESAPTTMYDTVVDYMPGPYEDYLPEPEAVIAETIKRYNR